MSDTNLHDSDEYLLAALEEIAALSDDVESLPYPIKIRFRMACYRAESALARAKGGA